MARTGGQLNSWISTPCNVQRRIISLLQRELFARTQNIAKGYGIGSKVTVAYEGVSALRQKCSILYIGCCDRVKRRDRRHIHIESKGIDLGRWKLTILLPHLARRLTRFVDRLGRTSNDIASDLVVTRIKLKPMVTISPHPSLYYTMQHSFISCFVLGSIFLTDATVAFISSSAFGVTLKSVTDRRLHFVLNGIREATEKSEVLRFGWDGTTALGGAVEVAKPARMLSEIRAAGETIPSECEVFNANVEMNADELMFEEVIEHIDKYYETQLLEFKNGDILNKQGENEGSAKILSYAALSNLDQATTLKLWGQYYREVLADPKGTSHQNIRNFMNYGWKGVPFENGIALTRKNVGEGEWDPYTESWIP
jgi:hypothetical protein